MAPTSLYYVLDYAGGYGHIFDLNWNYIDTHIPYTSSYNYLAKIATGFVVASYTEIFTMDDNFDPLLYYRAPTNSGSYKSIYYDSSAAIPEIYISNFDGSRVDVFNDILILLHSINMTSQPESVYGYNNKIYVYTLGRIYIMENHVITGSFPVNCTLSSQISIDDFGIIAIPCNEIIFYNVLGAEMGKRISVSGDTPTYLNFDQNGNLIVLATKTIYKI